MLHPASSPASCALGRASSSSAAGSPPKGRRDQAPPDPTSAVPPPGAFAVRTLAPGPPASRQRLDSARTASAEPRILAPAHSAQAASRNDGARRRPMAGAKAHRPSPAPPAERRLPWPAPRPRPPPRRPNRQAAHGPPPAGPRPEDPAFGECFEEGFDENIGQQPAAATDDENDVQQSVASDEDFDEVPNDEGQ
ncbi:hypothetical protein ZWY2020_038400 [Hordeum vulgare]|nr:hypothetical protein ZWY2020_038400 [Hordeum vulgare]